MDYLQMAKEILVEHVRLAQESGLSEIHSTSLLGEKCTCPGFHRDGVWFPMMFDKDCPLHGTPNAPANVPEERT